MTDFYYMTGKKLLVADDSLTIQKVIRLALSNEGYDIQAVSDGNDAIQQISLFRPDAVLIDVSLPGKTAFEVKRAINELSDLEEVRFVLLSSAFEKVDEVQANSVTFHGRLTKPFDPAHLRQVLTDVLAQVTSRRLEPTSLLNRPEDFEVTLPPPLPAAQDEELWDQPGGLTELPPLPPMESSTIAHDDDIKHLTESTLRMTGLADATDEEFEWSVNEPSLKPPAAMMDMGGSTLQIEPPVSLDSLPPLPLELPTETENALSPSEFYRNTASAAPSVPLSMPSLPQAQIEEIIQRELQNTIQRMAEKILPEVAERIIKQEIHRMLSETP